MRPKKPLASSAKEPAAGVRCCKLLAIVLPESMEADKPRKAELIQPLHACKERQEEATPHSGRSTRSIRVANPFMCIETDCKQQLTDDETCRFQIYETFRNTSGMRKQAVLTAGV